MPESGGPTTQSGILYQNSIAALFLGRLCDATSRLESESVTQVRAETPDNVDDIVVTFADNHKAFIQAKENVRVGDNAWKKLWQDFDQQYQNDNFQKRIDRLVLWVGSPHIDYDNLLELCQRARGSNDYQEWQSSITIDQKRLLEKIKPILSPELLEDSILVSFLKHIKIEIWSLNSIERDLLPYWMPETNDQSVNLFRLLRDRVGGASRIRATFTAHNLRDSLIAENHTLVFSTPTDIERIKSSIRSCSSLLRLHKNSIGNTHIHIRRNIVDEIVHWITASDDDSKNTVMLVDQAGTGKTVTLQDILVDLEDKGYDVLAIKADQQLSGLSSLSDISSKLNLPESPEQILSRLSQLGRVVVLIDQIDALSLSLAHDQKTLDIVLDLIARLRRISNLRILLSCRLFDRNSDPRLSQIDLAQQFTLTQFSDEEVAKILGKMGVSYQDMAKPTQVLLQVPLHLNLFSLALDNNIGSSERLLGVTSLQELYETIWQNIVLKEDLQAPSKTNRVEVLRIVKNYMSQEQTTSIPQSVLQKPASAHLERAIHWLASMGILIAGKGEWTFIHQTFFDYCYARDFVEQKGNLVETILQSNQGLFIRPQLIQVITYLRGTQPDLYLRNLQKLLEVSGLRYHLYDLLLRWFGSLPNPSDGEWLIARRMFLISEKRAQILERMFGNPGWFARLQNTLLPSWLSHEEMVDGLLLPYLTSIINIEITQAKVIEVLNPFLGKSEQWDERLLWAIPRIRNWYAIQAIEMYEQMVYKTFSLNKLDLYQLGIISKASPSTGIRLFQFLLDHVLKQYQNKLIDEKQKNKESNVAKLSGPSLYSELHSLDNNNLEEAFHFVSQAEPRKFIEAMLPWLENVLNQRNILDEPRPYYFNWDDLSGNWYNDHQSFEHAFVFSFINALINLAKSDLLYFNTITNRLSQLPYATPQYLLAHVFKDVPDVCASKALQFILADNRRLNLGDAGHQYDSRKLIYAIYPYLSNQERFQLEEFILQYAPIHKRRGVDGLRWRGIEQFFLLQSIPQEYLSVRALKRLNEWEHKFPKIKASEDPITSRGGFVQSPIPLEIATKMTDRQWLRAINKYHGAITHKDFLKGGADQLSSVLQILVKDTPQRYYSLLQQVDDDVDDMYVQAFLNGLAESEAPKEWLFNTIRRFGQHPNRHIRRTIAWSLEKRAKEEVPGDLIGLLQGYVHGGIDEDEWWWSEGKDHGDVYSSFLNSDRGAAFNALMRIFDGQNNDETRSRKWELIEFATSDLSAALRIGAIHELTYMIGHDRERAVNCFEKLMQGHEILIESGYTRNFIYWALYKNFLRLCPYIIAMMNHKEDNVQEQGAQLACIAGLSNTSMESEEAFQAAQKLAEQTMNASIPWKRGAAKIYAHNITEIPGDICIERLIDLLKEDDEQIQKSIGWVFYSLQGEHIVSLRHFIETYAQRSKWANHKFAEYLLEFGLLDPKWTHSVIQTILNNSFLVNNSPWLTGIEEFVRLVLRIYTDPTVSDEIRTTSMDMFDILMEKGPGFSQKVLSEWDQR
jgi:Cdc6-like AAA superfamily ATPase